MDAVSYAHSAKQAKRITGLMRIEETEPTEVELGTEWYVPSTGKTYKRINDGSNDVWIDVGSSGANAAIKQSEEFVVGTASGNYDGNSLNTFPTQYGYYTDYVLVVLNGKILAKDDFTATDGYNVVLAEDAVNGDIVEVIAFGTFVVADHYTKSEIDNNKADKNGDATQRFKVADATNDDEALNKGQLTDAIANTGNSLVSSKDVYFNNNALISIDGDGWNSDRSGTNIDHIWHDDSTNTWHFCSDASYKSTGNSVGQYGRVHLLQQNPSIGDAIRRGVTIDDAIDNEADSIITDANVFGDTSVGLDACTYKGMILGDICMFSFSFKIINFDVTADDSGFSLSVDLLTLLQRYDNNITGVTINSFSTCSLRLFGDNDSDKPELVLRTIAGHPNNEMSFFNGDAKLINEEVAYGFITGMVICNLDY